MDRIGQFLIGEDGKQPAQRPGTVAWAGFDVIGQNALCPQHGIENMFLRSHGRTSDVRRQRPWTNSVPVQDAKSSPTGRTVPAYRKKIILKAR